MHAATGAHIKLNVATDDVCDASIEDDCGRATRRFRRLGAHIDKRIDPFSWRVGQRESAEARDEGATQVAFLPRDAEVWISLQSCRSIQTSASHGRKTTWVAHSSRA